MSTVLIGCLYKKRGFIDGKYKFTYALLLLLQLLLGLHMLPFYTNTINEFIMQTSTTNSTLELLQKTTNTPDILTALRNISDAFPGGVIFSTSFSWEDQAIAHLIFSEQLPIEVFTLDTGRLFPETYSTWSSTLDRYKERITAYYPDAQLLQEFIAEKGPNSFYESVDNRKRCCFIRKVEPLQRALQGKQVWLTGIRAAHSPNRTDMTQIEWDASNNIAKYHPLLDWSTEELKAFIALHNIPYNPLHDRGFVSIGCAPCTRAVKPGEDFRAGRWWWEDADKKECGLHVHK
ncbi:phosphoadenosine phosphosulfate reductase [Filimonas lacunae]|uniref:Adenosine 5'-phosphosulfate reductase n=1 Tax=Filimonas lacunae TaxID=477680 RepID=A0A173MMU3_9BACT|nr:phosphoadenylyl-sulfate reductase [Filimonas lacunae]BAV08806.1 phosphoadenylyl-sulfate reductase [Filimonas lacunae]SIS62053.1 phosphoadenosine phosphosulfate reductase [Filimonas lacunae]